MYDTINIFVSDLAVHYVRYHKHYYIRLGSALYYYHTLNNKPYKAILGSIFRKVFKSFMKIVFAFSDKVANNDEVICRMYYFIILKQELGSSVAL